MDIHRIVQANPLFWLGKQHYLAYGDDPKISFNLGKTSPHSSEAPPIIETQSLSAGEVFTTESITLLHPLTAEILQTIGFANPEQEEQVRLAHAQSAQEFGGDLPLLLPAGCSISFPQDVTLTLTRPDITAHTREATLKDVAALSGLSLKTVSRVINNEAFVAPATRKRALIAVGQLGYRRNAPAHNLRSGTRNETIALITADLSNIFYAKITETVTRICAQHNFRVITASSEEDPALEREIIDDMIARGVSGILFTPAGHGYDYLDPYLEQGLAFGALDRPVPGKEIDAVVVENRLGTQEAIEAFLHQGHRRIGILLDALSIFTIQERYRGVLNAFAAHRLEFPEELLSTVVHTPEDSFDELTRLMTLPEPPTALFCGNNRALIGALRFARATGKVLPIISFEEFDLIDLFEEKVGLVDYSIAGLATQASRHLLDRIGEPNRPVQQTVMSTELRLP